MKPKIESNRNNSREGKCKTKAYCCSCHEISETSKNKIKRIQTHNACCYNNLSKA